MLQLYTFHLGYPKQIPAENAFQESLVEPSQDIQSWRLDVYADLLSDISDSH